MALKCATTTAMKIFFRDNVICRFGISKHLLSNNGTPFSFHCGDFWMITELNVNLNSYYPQGNHQAEATEKTIFLVISKIVNSKIMTMLFY